MRRLFATLKTRSKSSPYRHAFIAAAFGALILFSAVLGLQVAQGATSQSIPANIGLWGFAYNFFPSSNASSSQLQLVFHDLFASGSFNSLEMFTPGELSYSYPPSDTTFRQQLVTFAQYAEQAHFPLKMILEDTVDLQAFYNKSSIDYSFTLSFLQATQHYPEIYALGVNGERSTWGCEDFGCAQSTATAQQLSQAVTNFQVLVQCYNKQFISYYGFSVNGNPAPVSGTYSCPAGAPNNFVTVGSSWLQIGNAGFPSCYPCNGTHGNGYWTVNWFLQSQAPWSYVGISAGVFANEPLPDPLFYSNITGKMVAPCALTDVVPDWTSPGCGPGGQWNNVSMDWFFRQMSLEFQYYPSIAPVARQFIMIGVNYISNCCSTSPLIDNALGRFGQQSWNTKLFQGWVQAAEAKYSFALSSATSLSSWTSTSSASSYNTTVTTASQSSSEKSSTSTFLSSATSSATTLTVPVNTTVQTATSCGAQDSCASQATTTTLQENSSSLSSLSAIGYFGGIPSYAIGLVVSVFLFAGFLLFIRRYE